MDFDDDFSHVSSKTQKRVLRKSVQTTLRCWKGHKIMVLETQAFASKRAAPDVALKKVVARLAAGEPVSSTAKQVAVELGVPKKAVYARALQISKASPEAAARDANGPEGIEGVHF